jgi:hypothetical protein
MGLGLLPAELGPSLRLKTGRPYNRAFPGVTNEKLPGPTATIDPNQGSLFLARSERNV